MKRLIRISLVVIIAFISSFLLVDAIVDKTIIPLASEQIATIANDDDEFVTPSITYHSNYPESTGAVEKTVVDYVDDK